MDLLEVYRGLGKRSLDLRRAQSIVAEAIPHAVATLGLAEGTTLLVSAKDVEPEGARGGSLIPAWPVRQADGSVVIEYVEDWGALLSGFVVSTGAERCDPSVLAQRMWIGIANDVVQLFVADPPTGTYSMVRHHALMLATATAWLGPAAVSAWLAAHTLAGATFVRSSDRPLPEAVKSAEQGLETLLGDERAHQSAPRVLAWLDADRAARRRYLAFLGAASLGVAGVLQALPASLAEQADWLTHAVTHLHAEPDFNRDWIEESAFARGGSTTTP